MTPPPLSSESSLSPNPVRDQPGVGKRVWNYLTSFKLAVLVLGLSLILVFLGTLAQVHEGLYLAQARWFKSWLVLRQDGDPWWVLIFPGGYLLGTVFLVNMMGAHFRRFKFPPGGWFAMVMHYAAVMMGLFFITRSLLWQPFYFFTTGLALLGLDMALSRGKSTLAGSGKKIGIDFVHLGIAVLLLGQLGTDLLAKESFMELREGETKHYSQSHMTTELAVSHSVDEKMEEVTVIPEDLLKKPGETLSNDKLPFSIKIKEWLPNSDLVVRKDVVESEATLRQALATLESKYSSAEMLPAAAEEAMQTPGRRQVWEQALQSVGEPAGTDPVAAAKRLAADPAKAGPLMEALKSGFRKEMAGRFQMQGGAAGFAAQAALAGKTSAEMTPPPQGDSPVAQNYFTVPLPEFRDMDSRNIPTAVVELTGRDGKSLGTWLLTPALKEQTVTVQGQPYRISLRFERVYHSFDLTLLKTTHDKYPGTDVPKDFRSLVRIQEDSQNGDREAEIFMNSPLRFENGNLTFFQSQMGRDQTNSKIGTSGLQVVRNPGWFSPYFGCALVAYGMCRHFLLHLGRFINRKKAS